MGEISYAKHCRLGCGLNAVGMGSPIAVRVLEIASVYTISPPFHLKSEAYMVDRLVAYQDKTVVQAQDSRLLKLERL